MATEKPSLDTIVCAAVDIASAPERVAYVAGACGDDADLRARVDKLVAAHFAAGDFLQTAAPPPALTAADSVTERPGTVIGPYKLLQQIGEGGMGVVWMAEQTQPVQRKVALKVIKPGMDSRQVVARFEAERQALAMMDHVNIARVIDGGATENGRPYFVMELVHGMPITKYCDGNHLTPRERLELFIPVCHAIQHAHQKGIIHRDIKPSNVMVTLYDGKPVPKVIDFGVAKATEQRLTERTLFTQYGTMVGTLEYMSPEQAEMSALGVDTRSDIYSLGVLLYELLTGSTPLSRQRMKEAAFAEILRMIKEEEPPKPSTRLSDSGEALASISALRQTEPAKLTKLVRGELDWIVMKCLEKDRNRRYETANGFAADVQRYLNDEPVQACPPSAGYRFRKFARRNKWGLVISTLVGALVLLLLVGIPVTAVLRQERDRALDQRGRAERAEAMARTAEKENKIRAHLARAAALRRSGQAGQRFKSLGEIAEALKSNPSPELRAKLRNEAIGALALPDLHLTGPSNDWPSDAVAFDFDEAHAIYARTDTRGNCHIRRVADDAEIHRLPALNGLPYLSHDGKFIAVVGANPEEKGTPALCVQLWQIDGVTPRRVLFEARARFVDFHRNGQQVALAYTDGAIGLFELPSGRRLSHLAPDTLTREVTVALHPTEPMVAVCSYFGSVVQLRNVQTGKVLDSLPQGTSPVRVAWHPGGQILAVGMAEAAVIRLYDRATLRLIRTFERSQAASILAFNHAGDRLAAYGWGKYVELFDVGTGQKLFATTPGHYSHLRFSRDDQRLAGWVQDGKLGIWQVADGRECRRLVSKTGPGIGPSYRVSLHRDGRLLAAGTTEGFCLWDLASGCELDFIPMPYGHSPVLFEPSGALLTLGATGLARWPVRSESGSTDQLVVGPPGRIPLPHGHCLGQSQDGRVIVTCARDIGSQEAFAGGWILHADRPGEPIRLDVPDISYIAVSPDGAWVVTVTHGVGQAKVWNARDGKFFKQLTDRGAGFPSFSPDGRWLSTNIQDGQLFAVDTWEPDLRAGAWGTFAPKGKLMAVQSQASVVRLVDPATSRELARLEDPALTWTTWPIFSSDGTKLIGFNADKLIGLNNGIRVWDLRVIRHQLAKMGLDWEAPPYPSADLASQVVSPLKVEVRHGEPVSHEEQARRAIETYRRQLKATPNNPAVCNNLAWQYLTAPEPLRDAKAALPLAEKAVRLVPGNATYANTLGVAYYRNDRYREAVDTLRSNLIRGEDWDLAFDLYFLAMSYHKLDDTALAKVYFDWAVRWPRTNERLKPGHVEELNMFRSEAIGVLGLADKGFVEFGPPPRVKP
jgi:eukaryotic-like serine/threonine-protein kinase